MYSYLATLSLNGLSLTSQLIQSLAINLNGRVHWRHLRNGSYELLQNRLGFLQSHMTTICLLQNGSRQIFRICRDTKA
ncbi:hypothetical protein D1872_267430 [compost metagenome]